jgi:hypothetical protein
VRKFETKVIDRRVDGNTFCIVVDLEGLDVDEETLRKATTDPGFYKEETIIFRSEDGKLAALEYRLEQWSGVPEKGEAITLIFEE